MRNADVWLEHASLDAVSQLMSAASAAYVYGPSPVYELHVVEAVLKQSLQSKRSNACEEEVNKADKFLRDNGVIHDANAGNFVIIARSRVNKLAQASDCSDLGNIFG